MGANKQPPSGATDSPRLQGGVGAQRHLVPGPRVLGEDPLLQLAEDVRAHPAQGAQCAGGRGGGLE